MTTTFTTSSLLCKNYLKKEENCDLSVVKLSVVANRWAKISAYAVLFFFSPTNFVTETTFLHGCWEMPLALFLDV